MASPIGYKKHTVVMTHEGRQGWTSNLPTTMGGWAIKIDTKKPGFYIDVIDGIDYPIPIDLGQMIQEGDVE